MKQIVGLFVPKPVLDLAEHIWPSAKGPGFSLLSLSRNDEYVRFNPQSDFEQKRIKTLLSDLRRIAQDQGFSKPYQELTGQTIQDIPSLLAYNERNFITTKVHPYFHVLVWEILNHDASQMPALLKSPAMLSFLVGWLNHYPSGADDEQTLFHFTQAFKQNLKFGTTALDYLSKANFADVSPLS